MYACNMHWGAAAVAGGEAGWVLHQGSMLLLAQRPQWLASGWGSGCHTWARQGAPGEVGRRGEAVGRHGRAGGVAWGDRPSTVERAIEQAQWGDQRSRCRQGGRQRTEHVSHLLLLSLSKRHNGREDVDTIIKKMSPRRADVYWAGMQAHEGTSGRTDALHVSFPIFLTLTKYIRIY
jgi:hypothetical protein